MFRVCWIKVWKSCARWNLGSVLITLHLLRCEVLHTRKGRERERRANKQEITTSPAWVCIRLIEYFMWGLYLYLYLYFWHNVLVCHVRYWVQNVTVALVKLSLAWQRCVPVPCVCFIKSFFLKKKNSHFIYYQIIIIPLAILSCFERRIIIFS